MKTVFAILAVCLVAGCSFRDGASTTAASISSGALSCFGIYDSYDGMKDFYSRERGWNDTPETKLTAGNSTKPIVQNQ